MRWLRPGEDGRRETDALGVASGFAISACFLLSPLLPDCGFRGWWFPYLPVLPTGFVVSAWAYVSAGTGGRIEATRPQTAGWMAVVPMCLLGWVMALSGWSVFQGGSLNQVMALVVPLGLIALATFLAIARIETQFRRAPSMGVCILMVLGALGLLGQRHG